VAFALTAALMVSSIRLPSACSSMYSWMDIALEVTSRRGEGVVVRRVPGRTAILGESTASACCIYGVR
jgi:hypothetical protein